MAQIAAKRSGLAGSRRWPGSRSFDKVGNLYLSDTSEGVIWKIIDNSAKPVAKKKRGKP